MNDAVYYTVPWPDCPFFFWALCTVWKCQDGLPCAILAPLQSLTYNDETSDLTYYSNIRPTRQIYVSHFHIFGVWTMWTIQNVCLNVSFFGPVTTSPLSQLIGSVYAEPHPFILLLLFFFFANFDFLFGCDGVITVRFHSRRAYIKRTFFQKILSR